VPTAAHRDVEVLAGHARPGEGVGLVDRHALGAGSGGGVAELDVIDDVRAREGDRSVVAVAAPGLTRRANPQRPVALDRDDVPQRAVAHEPVRRAQVAVVVAGHDPVADPCGQAVVQLDPGALHGPRLDAVGASEAVEVAHGATVGGLQDGDLALVLGGREPVECGVEHLLAAAAGERAVGLVGVQGCRVGAA